MLSAQNIEDVKTEEHVGKTISVRGEVKNVIKIGELSAYILEDETGTIGVSTEDLPKEGDKVTARGTLIRDTLFGYYIKVN
jgi:RecJ-like exonuclease